MDVLEGSLALVTMKGGWVTGRSGAAGRKHDSRVDRKGKSVAGEVAQASGEALRGLPDRDLAELHKETTEAEAAVGASRATVHRRLQEMGHG